MRHILLLFIAAVCLSCDTKQTVIDTGVCSPYFDGTIMDYLRANPDYWDLTIQMIERAEMVDLLEGQVDTCPEITFFAPPSYSVQRFLWDTQADGADDGVYYETIADIPVEQCRAYILSHVVNGKHVKENMGYINEDYFVSDEKQDGGTKFTTLAGNRLLVYLQKSDWAGVPDVGPVSMGLYSLTKGVEIPVATPNIQPVNGVIHALHTGYDFGEI